MNTTVWEDVDAHVITRDLGTLAGYVIGGAVLALGIWHAAHPPKKYPEEIRRPGDPIAWPWNPTPKRAA